MCACGPPWRFPRPVPRGLGQALQPAQVAGIQSTLAAPGASISDWFYSTLTDIWSTARYNIAAGELSPAQVQAIKGQTVSDIQHAAQVAKASGADPATIDAIAHQGMTQASGEIDAAIAQAGATPGGGTSLSAWVLDNWPVVLAAAVGAYLVFK
jgi:hypothetical protein